METIQISLISTKELEYLLQGGEPEHVANNIGLLGGQQEDPISHLLREGSEDTAVPSHTPPEASHLERGGQPQVGAVEPLHPKQLGPPVSQL